ncbi:MAG TPA: hypothetical protein VGQ38_09220 [Gaiellaceae bacterium]|jgi:hypothetical protein|nr:hypothetical protein [Gaiellaceae bacterium]
MDELRHDLEPAIDTDDVAFAFARGFEIGTLWEKLCAGPDDAVSQHVHASNVEMLARLSETTSRHLQTVDIDDRWLIATYWPEGSLPSGPLR